MQKEKQKMKPGIFDDALPPPPFLFHAIMQHRQAFSKTFQSNILSHLFLLKQRYVALDTYGVVSTLSAIVKVWVLVEVNEGEWRSRQICRGWSDRIGAHSLRRSSGKWQAGSEKFEWREFRGFDARRTNPASFRIGIVSLDSTFFRNLTVS